MKRFLENTITASIILTIVSVPLAVFPWTQNAFELPKQVVLVSLTALGVIAWIFKMVVVDRKITFKRTPLDLPLIVFLGFSLLASLFSADLFSSLLGSSFRFSDGLVSLLAAVFFYFLVTNNIEKVGSLVVSFLLSVGVVMAVSYAALFGFLRSDIFPEAMRSSWFTPASSSPEGFAALLAVLTVFLSALAVRAEMYHLPRSGYLLFLFSALGLLFVFDFDVAWAILVVGLLFVIAGTLAARIAVRRQEGVEKKLWLPLVLLFLSVVFMFSSLEIPGSRGEFPREPALSQKISWSIALQTATESVKQAVVGTGPGTFGIDVSEFRGVQLNESSLWQVRFDRAGSFAAELLATTGFLGFFSYLFLMFWFFLASWVLFRKGKSLAFVSGVVALLASQFFGSQTAVLAFTFLLFLALSAVTWENKLKDITFNLKKAWEVDAAAKALSVVLAGVLLAATVGVLRVAAAEGYYMKALGAGSLELGRQIENVEKASSLSPWQAEYRIMLSQLYLERALFELGKTDTEQNKERIAKDVESAIANAKGSGQVKGAVELSPRKAAAWEAVGLVYQAVPVPGAADWAKKGFETAIALEPANPALAMELGKVHVQEGELQKAKERFEDALALKGDYAEAGMRLALVVFEEGNTEEAISQLRALLGQNPSYTEAAFELGKAYYNTGEVEASIVQFTKVLGQTPNHSNALFALGAAFERQGNKEEAIAQFEKVLQLNPGNQAVQERLIQLGR